MMKKYLLILSLFLLAQVDILACSMFSFTVDGKTIVGNNEDYFDPDTWMWTVKAGKGKYGSVFFGMGNFFAQGGMNEAGLVFDGFAMDAKTIHNTEGKKSMNPAKLMQKVMSTCSTVAEVEKLMKNYALKFLKNGQLMFADKSGATLIVEGEDYIYSESPYQIATNFYQSSTPKDDFHKVCARYAKGDEMLGNHREYSIDYAKSVLSAMHQEGFWGGTQYSNIYDLKEGKIYLYLFHNYEEVVELSLADLLQKNEHKTEIHTLFQDTEKYFSYRKGYERSQDLLDGLTKHKSPESLKKSLDEMGEYPQVVIWAQQLFEAGDHFQEKEQHEMAILLINYAKGLFPESWKLRAMLAKSYFLQKETQKAKIEIEKALELKPGDPSLLEAKEKILAGLKE